MTEAEIVRRYQPLVRRQAARYQRPGADFDDLVSEGSIALLIAARRWDPERGMSFVGYAKQWVNAFVYRFALRHGHGIVMKPFSMRYDEIHALPRDASLDANIDEDDDRTLHELIAADGVTPEQQAITKQTSSMLAALRLDPIDRDILESRFKPSPETRISIGKRWGFSRERIRQRETTLLKRARRVAEAGR